jgi:hypothetical protein
MTGHNTLGRTTGLLLPVLFILSFMVATSDRAFASTNAQDVRSTEFFQLKEPDQLAYLREALLEFRRRTANISAMLTYSVHTVVYDPMAKRIGDQVLQSLDLNEFRMRRIKGSYRIEVDIKPTKPKPGEVFPKTIEGYNADKGLDTQLDIFERAGGSPYYAGTVKTTRAKVADQCFFYQYLGDGPRRDGSFGDWFLENIGTAKVLPPSARVGIVEVSFPYPAHGTSAKGTCVVSFDLNKGALLTGLSYEVETSDKKGSVRRNTCKRDMSEPVQVDGVWIPTKMRWVAWSSNYPKYVTIHEGTVKNISLNTLQMSDLDVTFVPGTEVMDETVGERYRVGPDGSRVAPTIQLPATDLSPNSTGRR